MDLGTANTIITSDGKIVVDEPSVVALDRRTDKMIAVGEKAKLMYEKTHDNIRTVRPLREGVIADFYACEQLMRGLIKMVHTGSRLFSPSLRMVIGVPSGSTEVELRAVRDSAEHAGGRDVYLIYEPMAAAIGAGLQVAEAAGCMVVDIGGGTSEVAVISLGDIVTSCSVRTAGDDFDEAIISYIKKKYNLLIGERTAEDIKISIGSAFPSEEETSMEVKGRNLIDGLPKNITVSSEEVREALADPVSAIVDAIRSTLERTPPELSADIIDNGIMLTGGGALLRGLDVLVARETGMPVHVAENPLDCVAVGTGKCLDIGVVSNFRSNRSK